MGKTRFGINEIWAIIDQELGIDQYAERNLTVVVHRWIGEKHIHETGRSVGSGNRIEYTEKDIRRAIAYVRTKRVIGSVTGSVGAEVTSGLRQVASYFADGYAVAYVLFENDELHIDHLHKEGIVELVGSNVAFVAIPCVVEVLDQRN